MKKQDYNVTIVADSSAAAAFKCINRVSAWWTENLEGSSEKLNDIFTIRFGETFVTMKIVEMILEKKIIWLVTDCYLIGLRIKKSGKTPTLFLNFPLNTMQRKSILLTWA